MAKYEIVFRKSVAKDLANLPKRDVQRIVNAIATLANDACPPQSRKLTGEEKYRLRCGVCRILYNIEDEKLIVCIVKIAHRNDVCQG